MPKYLLLCPALVTSLCHKENKSPMAKDPGFELSHEQSSFSESRELCFLMLLRVGLYDGFVVIHVDWSLEELAFCFPSSISEASCFPTLSLLPIFSLLLKALTTFIKIESFRFSSSYDQMNKPTCICPHSLLFPIMVSPSSFYLLQHEALLNNSSLSVRCSLDTPILRQ